MAEIQRTFSFAPLITADCQNLPPLSCCAGDEVLLMLFDITETVSGNGIVVGTISSFDWNDALCVWQYIIVYDDEQFTEPFRATEVEFLEICCNSCTAKIAERYAEIDRFQHSFRYEDGGTHLDATNIQAFFAGTNIRIIGMHFQLSADPGQDVTLQATINGEAIFSTPPQVDSGGTSSLESETAQALDTTNYPGGIIDLGSLIYLNTGNFPSTPIDMWVTLILENSNSSELFQIEEEGD